MVHKKRFKFALWLYVVIEQWLYLGMSVLIFANWNACVAIKKILIAARYALLNEKDPET